MEKSNSELALVRRTMQVESGGRPKSFQDSRQQLDEIDSIAEGKLAQDLFGLPPVFNSETQKRNAKDECSLCLQSFSVVTFFGMGTKEVICKRCGNSVCENCSKNKRQVARLDPVAYTVCDMCDTQLDNVSVPFSACKTIVPVQVWLRYSMHMQMKTLEKKAQILKMYLGFHEKRKKEYQDAIEAERTSHEQKIIEKRNLLQKLRSQVTTDKKKIARLELEIETSKRDRNPSAI